MFCRNWAMEVYSQWYYVPLTNIFGYQTSHELLFFYLTRPLSSSVIKPFNVLRFNNRSYVFLADYSANVGPDTCLIVSHIRGNGSNHSFWFYDLHSQLNISIIWPLTDITVLCYRNLLMNVYTATLFKRKRQLWSGAVTEKMCPY